MKLINYPYFLWVYFPFVWYEIKIFLKKKYRCNISISLGTILIQELVIFLLVHSTKHGPFLRIDNSGWSPYE